MRITFIATGILAMAWTAAAQQKSLSCDDRNNNNNNNKQVTHCEMREQTVAFAGRLAVDAGVNGGVSVKGWDGASVLVRAKVQASGADDASARGVASQITLNTSAGQVTATGPEQSKDNGWQVSYEIFVPRQGDLSLKANNGGIAISDVRGHIQFDTRNGGVTLKRLAGDVEGTTMNGGLTIELAGARWDGTKLDARTTNGGVNVSMPEGYSAHFETATVNGNLNLAFPMTVHGEIGRKLVTDIGSGGPTVHVETTNGGVNVKKM
jgi:DUF4097 and DUF4098 domain-containing protein YvlB